jgi:hypothetical protein
VLRLKPPFLRRFEFIGLVALTNPGKVQPLAAIFA